MNIPHAVDIWKKDEDFIIRVTFSQSSHHILNLAREKRKQSKKEKKY